VTHAAANTVQAFIPMPDWRILLSICLVAALVMIVAERMWEKLPPDHPAVYQAPMNS
jgi:hypothetical protein